MTFRWTKKQLQEILYLLESDHAPGIHDNGKCFCRLCGELKSLLAAMDMTQQENIYASQRGNSVYLTGRHPEVV